MIYGDFFFFFKKPVDLKPVVDLALSAHEQRWQLGSFHST